MSETFAFDTLGPIRGFRMWQVSEDRLLAPVRRTEWPAREALRARCARERALDGRPMPHPRCGCGIYATRTIEPLLPAVGIRAAFRWAPAMPVLGEVRLWGRVFEHQLGWRAEWAYPVGLFRTWERSLDDRMARLLERYGIEPLEVPETLRPQAGLIGELLGRWRKPSRRGWDDDPPGALVPV